MTTTPDDPTTTLPGDFMGYTQPWYSVRDVDAQVGTSMGYLTCFPRDGDRVFSPTQRRAVTTN
ncbi:hypothetical protein [Micromonospora sp. NPDC007230]|uniref:hypothetical protein n=1 Tax=Micromonospora sp. NPDC007230 TaxID=3364237 RepID=UPI003679786B